MYHYVENKELVSAMRQLCGDIMQDLCQALKEYYEIGAIFYLVGSGARNLITQNENKDIDLDYNLEIVKCNLSSCREIKEAVKKTFNIVLREYGWNDCEDSTAALTAGKRYFPEISNTRFSIDVAIVSKNKNGSLQRLIHKKTGWVSYDEYIWNVASNSKKINEKVRRLKKEKCWLRVRNEYLKVKNKYLTNNDYNHSSFICYIEAVNNIYNLIK